MLRKKRHFSGVLCEDWFSNHMNKELALTLICIKWVPGDPSTIFLATIFTQKMPERSGSMYSSILMLENIYYHFTSVDRIHKKF